MKCFGLQMVLFGGEKKGRRKGLGGVKTESAARKGPAGRIIIFMRFVENVYL
jgi:hypothetical protein